MYERPEFVFFDEEDEKEEIAKKIDVEKTIKEEYKEYKEYDEENKTKEVKEVKTEKKATKKKGTGDK